MAVGEECEGCGKVFDREDLLEAQGKLLCEKCWEEAGQPVARKGTSRGRPTHPGYEDES